jgi:hypothetical protein
MLIEFYRVQVDQNLVDKSLEIGREFLRRTSKVSVNFGQFEQNALYQLTMFCWIRD